MFCAEAPNMNNPTSQIQRSASRQRKHLSVRDQAFTLFQFAGLIISARERGKRPSPLSGSVSKEQDWRASTISYLDIRTLLEELWLCDDRADALFGHAKHVNSRSFGAVIDASSFFDTPEERIAFCARNLKTAWKASTEHNALGIKLFHQPKFFDPEMKSALEVLHFVNCASVVRSRSSRREHFLELGFTADCGIGKSALEHFFGCRVRFDVDIAYLHFNPGLHPPKPQSETYTPTDLRQLCALIEQDIQDEGHTFYQMLIDGVPQISSSEELARKIGVSRRTLVRLLDQEGLNFSTLWREACLHHAKKLITDGLAFEDVATRLGYADDRSFRRAFASWTGMSPSSFRRHPRT
jgi:AraC-like DNA-binding protein